MEIKLDKINVRGTSTEASGDPTGLSTGCAAWVGRHGLQSGFSEVRGDRPSC